MSVFNLINVSLVKGLAVSIGMHAAFFGAMVSNNGSDLQQDKPSYIEVSFEPGGLNQDIICPPSVPPQAQREQELQKKAEDDTQIQIKSEATIAVLSEKQNESSSISYDELQQQHPNSKDMQTMDCCRPSNINIKYEIDGSAGSGQGLKILRAPKPFYPQESRKIKEEGEVVVAVVVSPEGKIQSVSVAVSSGFSRLDEAALKAARKIRFSADVENPSFESVVLRVPYKFEIL
ncbi:MAG: TonB family protein [Endomicrobium sp.]|jgi:TonB family protein|nr:TonB family protein [Endomicrobium sp.]